MCVLSFSWFGAPTSCRRRADIVPAVYEEPTPSLTVGLPPRSLTGASILHLYNPGLSSAVHRNDEQMVVLALWNNRIVRPAERCDNFGNRIVVPGDKDCLPRMLRANLRQQISRALGIDDR